MENIIFNTENTLNPEEFTDILRRSGLAEKRPTEDPQKIAKMCQYANLIITARNKEGKIIGIARSLTDFAFCTYLSDLAVDRNYQHKGIGKQLIHFTKAQAPEAKLVLFPTHALVEFYPRTGLEKHTEYFIY